MVRLLLLLLAFVATAPDAPGEARRGEFHGALQTTYPDWFKESFLDFHEDIADAAAAGKRVVLLFHQDGCPYCNALVERNLAQKDIEAYVRQHFDVVALNMWGDREVVTVGGERYSEKELAAVMRVQFTPTLLFFDERGQVALRLDGYLPPRRFKQALEYVVTGGADRHGTLRAYLAAAGPSPAEGRLNDAPFLQPPPHQLAAPRSRPLAVLFEQVDCPNCDVLHREVLALEATRRILADFDVVQLDMWADTPVVTPAGESLSARAWADRLGLSYAPSIVLFDADGREVIRSDAYFKRFHTQSILDYVRSGAYRDEPSFQRYISARAEQLRESGQDVDIWD